MVGVGIADGRAAEVVQSSLANGLILNAPNADNLRIVPPLIIGEPELEAFDERFRAAVAAL